MIIFVEQIRHIKEIVLKDYIDINIANNTYVNYKEP